MISKYDPLHAPNPEKWLELDDDQRIQLILQYHKKEGIETPNDQIHAVIHNIIENQIAKNEKSPVKEAVNRLTDEGLDRHEAIHAVGSVLIKHMVNNKSDKGDSTQSYFEEVKNLTLQKWKEEYS